MDIKENIKSGLYAGIGAMLKGKEKVEEIAKEFIKDKNLNKEEGEKFVKDVVEKATETKDEITKYVDERVQQIIDKIGFVKKEDYDNLKKELEDLKASIDKKDN